ncbi:MAG: DUF302 domain-containing protein [Desulfitobacterium hafniense]|nr:DUF302 domain-containing protein [Desulfitobacterium hafniense]
MNDIIYQVTTDNSFEETVTAVEVQTQAHGFKVLHVHDVQATLAEKGFTREPLKIIEVCNAKYAHTALQIEVTVSLLMPCRINVYHDGEKTVITTLRPTALVNLFDKPELVNFAEEVDSIIRKIIDSSK